jgi:putative hydrolase of the HAD superfamily
VLIIFDLDNTLIDRDAAFSTCLDQIMEKYRVPLSSDFLQKIFEKDNSGRCNREEFCHFLANFLPELGLNEDQIWAEFQELPTFVQPNNVINNVLLTLSVHHTLCLLSNGSGSMQRAKLDNAELPPVFDHVFISGEMGVAKPDRRIFKEVLDHYQAQSEECGMICDDLVRDIEPARAMGLHTIWVEAFMEDRVKRASSDNVVNDFASHFRVYNALDIEEYIIQCSI